MLGLAPSQVRRLPVRDIAILRRYWDEEPWGPWRDNMHAAIIAREVNRPYAGKRRKLSLDPYMLVPEEIRRDGSAQKLIGALKAIATKVTLGKNDDRSRKTGRPIRGGNRKVRD